MYVLCKVIIKKIDDMASHNRCQSATPTSSANVSFKSVQLFKDETLGIGSYGKVCRAKCDQLPCAAKIIHESLVDPTAEQTMPRGCEHKLPIKRFEQECEFLNTIRHPNVIQYLGMCRDPDTGLPVLLMELMDDNLTHFLEAATQQIPYHVLVNICHDITMAFTFLHANGIVHRDLSSNNVLMISNVKAKVTDFGMARLGDLNPRTSCLTFTMCPGTYVYMPPEAVQDQPVYTEKIDCFSFGVIIVQMLTRQFPKPGDRMQRVEINHPGLPRGTLMVCIPEVDRRQNHISQVDPNHPLLPISLDCLKDKDVERPSAELLCERVAALKDHSKYTESARTSQANERDLQEQIQSQREKHTREICELTKRLTEKDDVIFARNDTIASRDEEIAAKEKEITDKNLAIHARDREIQQLREQLEQITLRMTQRGETREPSVERRIQNMAISNRQECAAPSDIKLRWRIVATAPKIMSRSCNAAVSGSEIYFNVGGKRTMYSYNINSELWFKLPDCPNEYSSFAVVNNLLTAIGGALSVSEKSNKLHSLKQQTQEMQWVEELPPMPTKRSSTTSICTRTALIVAGGRSIASRLELTFVEVMNTETHQWSIAADLPIASDMIDASGVVCGDHLYLVGGNSRSTYSCSLSDLLQSCQSVLPAAQQRSSNTASVWRKLADLPGDVQCGSTAVLLNGQLLAIGGGNSTGMFGKPTNAVYMYKPATNSWEVVSRMSVARRNCFAVTLPTNKVMVVGGYKGLLDWTDIVEIADTI